MKVHGTLGNGFQEVIYQKCLAMPIFYNEIKVGSRRVDFLVEELIMVELKAVSRLEDLHLAQALNYLEAYKLETALLINFDAKSIEFKRLSNEYKLKSQSKS
jgi:hypothetical protein